MFPGLQPPDKYASNMRLEAILSILKGNELGHIIDLGGNSGFFCLSIVDAGLAKSGDVYDFSSTAITAGREMAQAMELHGNVCHHEKYVDLQFLKSLKPVDTIICLNLLHHAGTAFDKDAVQSIGWGAYAGEWLAAMRNRARIGIFGVGFEPRKPANWDVPHPDRPATLAHIAESAGWSICYDASVEDLCTLGIEAANGRYSKGGAKLAREQAPTFGRRIVKRVAKRAGLQFARPKQVGKLARYHLYILE